MKKKEGIRIFDLVLENQNRIEFPAVISKTTAIATITLSFAINIIILILLPTTNNVILILEKNKKQSNRKKNNGIIEIELKN